MVSLVSTRVQIWNTLGLSQPSLRAEWLQMNWMRFLARSSSESPSSGKESSVYFSRMMVSKVEMSAAVEAEALVFLMRPLPSCEK